MGSKQKPGQDLVSQILFGGGGGKRQQTPMMMGGGSAGMMMNRGRGGQTGGVQGMSGGGAGQRLEQFLGTPLGVPQTDLQRQTGDAVSQFLSQPAPEQRALDVAMPMLQDIISGRATPGLESGLRQANQSGGRFGSANAIMRGTAMEHLMQQQMGAAQTLGGLSAQAGQNPFQRLLGGEQLGQHQAQQPDIGVQRQIQLLMHLLSGQLGMEQQQGGGFMDILAGLGGMAAGSILGPAGAAVGSKVGRSLTE
jgi:hypothetical protein